MTSCSKKYLLFFFFFFFEGEKEKRMEVGQGTEKVAERGRKKERGGLAATVEQGLPPGGQFYFGNMFLSGRGQRLLPLFSIIQNKY